MNRKTTESSSTSKKAKGKETVRAKVLMKRQIYQINKIKAVRILSFSNTIVKTLMTLSPNKRKNSDVFEMMMKNNAQLKLNKMLNDQKQKEINEKKRQEEFKRKKVECAKVAAKVKLPDSTISSKLTANYSKMKEIISLIKDENVALDSAVNEIFKHNRFIRDKTVENEQRIKQLLNYIK